MALGGLWHGAAYNFLVWGFFHGFGLVLTHLVREIRTARAAAREAAGLVQTPSPVRAGVWKVLCWTVTFAFVNVAWVFFGAEDAGKAVDILKRVALWTSDGAGFRPTCLVLVCIVLGVQLLGLSGRDHFRKSFEWLPLPLQGAALGLAAACILKLGPDGVLPFIYFQF